MEKLKELKNIAKEVEEGKNKTTENIQVLVEDLKRKKKKIK